jgi:hypothetical protein
LANADDPEAHIDNYTKLVDLLCRLNREIAHSQKYRDDDRRTLGPEYNPAKVKDHEQNDAINMERCYSDLDDPAAPKPLLPAVPTATHLATEAFYIRRDAEKARAKAMKDMMARCLQKNEPAAAASEPPKS